MFRKFLTALLLGFNSGITFALMGATTTAYFKNIGLDLALIGFLTLRMMPYSLKYLWAPAVESLRIGFYPHEFGQRKSWILTMQMLLFFLLISLGIIDAKDNLFLFLILLITAIIIAATHDIAMDAYRIEIFKTHNPAKGNSFIIIGFRIGFFVSSALGLMLADLIGWNLVYITLGIATLPCIMLMFFAEDKHVLPPASRRKPMHWFRDQIIEPLKILWKMEHIFFILMIISFYKMSDGYLDAMLIPFLLDIGFTNTNISIYYSTVANFAFIAGTVISVRLVEKINVFKFMIVAEVMAASTNLLFLLLVSRGAVLELLAIINMCESFCSGICNIMLITYMSSLCHHKFSATHYAILICISSTAKVLTSSSSGYIAETFGWHNFFIISALLSIPSLICLIYLAFFRFKKSDVQNSAYTKI